MNLLPAASTGDAGKRLVDDFRNFVDELEAWLESMRSSSGSTMSTVRSRMDDTLSQARDRFDDVRSMATERAGAAMETAQDYVRREPMKVLGIAIALGAIAVLVLGASRSRSE
jgi:ElaB/YqjD/DUF883 family membrane-anchored ribosome-binding protein